ncbi:hypothetical protein AC1031_012954 [Aphanomyces cochlioides]|nr:hypothetical protein AC1031_012954 [Aphanomyces cochlioides]
MPPPNDYISPFSNYREESLKETPWTDAWEDIGQLAEVSSLTSDKEYSAEIRPDAVGNSQGQIFELQLSQSSLLMSQSSDCNGFSLSQQKNTVKNGPTFCLSLPSRTGWSSQGTDSDSSSRIYDTVSHSIDHDEESKPTARAPPPLRVSLFRKAKVKQTEIGEEHV